MLIFFRISFEKINLSNIISLQQFVRITFIVGFSALWYKIYVLLFLLPHTELRHTKDEKVEISGNVFCPKQAQLLRINSKQGQELSICIVRLLDFKKSRNFSITYK